MAGMCEIHDDLKKIYRTALEIAPEWHVRMQAAFQKHCDNGVSKTVNLPFEASPEDVASVYRLAAESGCKGITVYRDRCRNNQVLNIGCVVCA
jgi:ribonucleoside-diphosphate reductase alpha chain